MKNEYDLGFDKGHDLGYKCGFNEGFVWGKRSIISESFGQGFKYAWSFNDKKKKNISALLKKIKSKLQPVSEVANDIEKALANNTGLSIIRIGDGELMVIAQDLIPTKLIRLRGHMLWKHLNKIPDYKAQSIVLNAIWQANWVGMPFGRGFPDCDVVLALILLERNILPAKLTHSVINYRLSKLGYLSRLIKEKKILAIGNTSQELKESLIVKGFNCIGAISPVNKIYDLERVFSEVINYDFDIALVAAGVAAVPLCVRIATRLNKVALDFGHMSDEFINDNTKI